MGIIIILFFIAIILAYLMLSFRAWEIKTLQTEPTTSPRQLIPEMYFRHLEKIMLHLAKHIIQWIVLVVVKYWFIIYTKTKKWGVKNLPKVYKYFKKETTKISQQENSFIQKAILESKIKIKRIREKVRKEHEE